MPPLLTAAHNQLRAPIALIWDNLGAHIGPVMRAFIDERNWLTVFRFPGYAPELNPAEGVWANLKSRLRNLAVRTVDQLTTVIKTHLKRMHYRRACWTPISPRPASPSPNRRKPALSTSGGH